jgi:hypothetical protein
MLNDKSGLTLRLAGGCCWYGKGGGVDAKIGWALEPLRAIGWQLGNGVVVEVVVEVGGAAESETVLVMVGVWPKCCAAVWRCSVVVPGWLFLFRIAGVIPLRAACDVVDEDEEEVVVVVDKAQKLQVAVPEEANDGDDVCVEIAYSLLGPSLSTTMLWNCHLGGPPRLVRLPCCSCASCELTLRMPLSEMRKCEYMASIKLDWEAKRKNVLFEL